MTFVGYSPETPGGRVRLLIDDTDTAAPVFTNEEIAAFLSMNRNSERRAAAQALLMIAGSEARLSKKLRTQDLQTDGPAVAAELRLQAQQLRKEANEEEQAETGSFFEVVEYPYGAVQHPELTEHRTW